MATIGSQALLRILPYTHYDFGPLSDAAIEIPIAQHIDVLGYQHAALQVRINAGSFPAGSSLRIHLADDGFNPDDPTTNFLQKTVSGQEIGTLSVTDRTMFPFYQSMSTAIPGAFGRMMGITASFTGGAEGGPSVVMGMDLLLTGGSVGTTIHQPSTYLGYAYEPVETEEAFETVTFERGQPVPFGPELITRLVTVIGDVFKSARLPPGYPRFRNVDVARRPDQETLGRPRPDAEPRSD
jgi:hypothetical protein